MRLTILKALRTPWRQTCPAAQIESIPCHGRYLLRDWTDTAEFRGANAKIGAAIRQAFPDPSGKSLAFAGCGAGGLLAEVPPGFARVLGYNLALPTLAAARRLLDGKGFDLPLPSALHKKRPGRVA